MDTESCDESGSDFKDGERWWLEVKHQLPDSGSFLSGITCFHPQFLSLNKVKFHESLGSDLKYWHPHGHND